MFDSHFKILEIRAHNAFFPPWKFLNFIFFFGIRVNNVKKIAFESVFTPVKRKSRQNVFQLKYINDNLHKNTYQDQQNLLLDHLSDTP